MRRPLGGQLGDRADDKQRTAARVGRVGPVTCDPAIPRTGSVAKGVKLMTHDVEVPNHPTRKQWTELEQSGTRAAEERPPARVALGAIPRFPPPPKLPNLKASAGAASVTPARTAPPIGGSVAPVAVPAAEDGEARGPRSTARSKRLRVALPLGAAAVALVLVGVGLTTNGWKAWTSSAGQAAEGTPATEVEGYAPPDVANAMQRTGSAPDEQADRTTYSAATANAARTALGGSQSATSIVVPTTVVAAKPAREVRSGLARAGAADSTADDQRLDVVGGSRGPAAPDSPDGAVAPIFSPPDGSSNAITAASPPTDGELRVTDKPHRHVRSTEDQTLPTRLEPDRVSARGRLRIP